MSKNIYLFLSPRNIHISFFIDVQINNTLNPVITRTKTSIRYANENDREKRERKKGRRRERERKVEGEI